MNVNEQEALEQLTELEQDEERVRQERIKLQKYLDTLDLERLEWERMQNDMYPGIKPEQDDD